MTMHLHSRAVLLIAALAFPFLSQAGNVKVENAWLRATVPGQKVAGAFMDITANKAMTLIGGETPVAESVELHYMKMEGGVMEMRELESIDLPKDKTVSLEPGGLHAMLIGIKAQINAGDKVPVTLIFKDSSGQCENLGIVLEAFTPRY